MIKVGYYIPYYSYVCMMEVDCCNPYYCYVCDENRTLYFLPTIRCMMKIVMFFTNHIFMDDENRLVFPIIVMCVMKIDCCIPY